MVGIVGSYSFRRKRAEAACNVSLIAEAPILDYPITRKPTISGRMGVRSYLSLVVADAQSRPSTFIGAALAASKALTRSKCLRNGDTAKLAQFLRYAGRPMH